MIEGTFEWITANSKTILNDLLEWANQFESWLQKEKEQNPMAKLKFTGSADAPATYQGKYEVTTGSVIDVGEGDVNALLQTGVFEVVEDEPAKKEFKKSDDSDNKGKK